jgi:hypothetical protein
MPWVPVERAGSAGGNSGRVGSCKHVQISPDLTSAKTRVKYIKLRG